MAPDNPLSDQEMTLVRNALDAVELTDQMLASAENATVSFAEIYAYATNPEIEPSAWLLQALSEDGRVRRDFDALLRNTSQYFLPQVAAASSGDVSTREIDGCKITFRSSRADADQIFVIIKLVDHDARPGSLFILDEAHIIRNRRTMGSVATCALQASRRWCLSGTPLMNGVDDAFALFRFLRYQPFACWPHFNNHISRPSASRRRVEARVGLGVGVQEGGWGEVRAMSSRKTNKTKSK